MNFDELPLEERLRYVNIASETIAACTEGLDKDEFLLFCEAIWGAMELNGVEKFREAIEHQVELLSNEEVDHSAHKAIEMMNNKT